MLTYPIPHNPWERIQIDTLELPLSENGYKHLFVAINYFSRYCILKPIVNEKENTIASTIVDEMIVSFTTPHMIVTDNYTEFHNKLV